MDEIQLTAVLVAVITGLCGVLGQWIISSSNMKKRKIDDAVHEAKRDMQLEAIGKKLDEHNGYAARFGEIEKAIVEIKTELKNIKG